MRVLLVMESTIGGTRRHLVDLAGGLLRAGDEVHLCVAAERQASFRADLARLADEGAHVHELPMVRSIAPRTDWIHKRAMQRLITGLKPDVVHTHSSKAGALGRLAASAADCHALVHTPHTFAFLFDNMFSAKKRRLFRWIETHLAKRTTRMIAVSAGERDTMVKAGVIPAERVRVVPNGVEPEAWQNARAYDRADLQLSPDTQVVLVVGLLNSAKGQDLAIRALAAGPLVARPCVQLVLAGHGDDLPMLQALTAKLELAGRVHFLGWRDDIPRLMATADVVLLPSRWEGMPYVVLEAMAAGKPVVATRVDGARDLIEPGATGLLVDVGDVDGLAAALARVLDGELGALSAVGARALARVAAGYTIDHMVAATRRVYQEAREAAHSIR